MGETETRTVETEFTAKDAGYGAAMNRMLETYQKGVEHLSLLKEKMSEFRQETGLSTLGALGLGVGIGSWVEHAKEVNAEFGHTQEAIAGVLAGSLKFEKGATEIDRYRRSLVLSKEITEQLEEASARYGSTLDEEQAAYRTTAAAAGALGLTQKQVMDLTQGAIATGRAYGASGEEAATRVAQALQMGKVRGLDPFSIALRRATGNMQHLSQAARLDHLEKALRGSMQVAEEMNNGIDGSLARARQTVDSVFRGATAPLFAEVAKSLGEWAKHLKEAQDNGKPLIEDISGKLVSGFHAVETASRFIKEHWLSIGAVFATLKAGDTLKSMAEGASAMGGKGGLFGGIAGGFAGPLGTLANSIIPVVGALAAFKVGLDAAIGAVEAHVEKERALDEKAGFGTGSIETLLKAAQAQKASGYSDPATTKFAQRAVEELKKYGMVGAGGLDQGALGAAVSRLDSGQKESLATKLGIRNPNLPVSAMSGSQFTAAISNQIGDLVKTLLTPAAKAVTDSDASRKFAKSPVQNFFGGVHIQQKFEDADPDRVFLRFKSDLENLASTPMQSREAEHESH